MQVNPLEHRVTVPVAEMHIREADVTAELGELDRIGCVGNGRGQVEELEDALQACPSLLADRQDPGELSGRRQELGDVSRERKEGAERDVVMEREPSAKSEDRNLRE